ncbi:MAG: sensor histidine kinase [Ktedonobacteraceae bacterium]
MHTTRSPLARSFWYSVEVVIVFNSLFLAWVLFKPGTRGMFVIGDDVGQALGWLLATLLCFVGLEKPWQRTSPSSDGISLAQRWVPVLLALGIFCQFIGQIIYTYDDIFNLSNFPSLADVAYLSTFPFLLSGILLLPIRPLSGITRARVTLDGFMIMTAVITFSWYFVLGPTIIHGRESIFDTIVGSAYPFFDLVLIFCVIRLSFRSSDPTLRPVVYLLSLGLIIIVITDSIYDYQTLQDTYTNGLQDLGWPVGYMLIGLAAQVFSTVRKHTNNTRLSGSVQVPSSDTSIAISSGWQTLLPYALVPALILLIAYTWRTDINLERGVYIGAAILIILVFLRQLLAIRETIFYNKELQHMQQELHRKNDALSAANMQLEQQRAQVEAAYEQQRHLNELKDQFLLNVNHELRTPLTEIRGYLGLLSEYNEQLDKTTQATFLEHAVQGCEELQHLVSNVLNALQGDFLDKPPQYTALALKTIVGDIFNLFEPQKQLDYNLHLDIPAELFVWADQQYLRRILLNLLSNAFKYSPKQTPVKVSAWVDESAITEGTGTPRVYICVQDSGPGIPPSEISVLFGKFVRLKRDLVGNVRGTGLGLYICKQLVEAMEGHIWVESSGIPGQGSRFCLALAAASHNPLKEQAQSASSTAEPASLSD